MTARELLEALPTDGHRRILLDQAAHLMGVMGYESEQAVKEAYEELRPGWCEDWDRERLSC